MTSKQRDKTTWGQFWDKLAYRIAMIGGSSRPGPESATETDKEELVEFSEARPCEPGDEMCVDPYPCSVHDRLPAPDERGA